MIYTIDPTMYNKFLDKTLADVNAPTKVRAMFRSVYSVTSAFTTVPKCEGKDVKSDVFKIRREVQGDITSPLYFILTFELCIIMRRHDVVVDKGVPLAQTMLHTRTYPRLLRRLRRRHIPHRHR